MITHVKELHTLDAPAFNRAVAELAGYTVRYFGDAPAPDSRAWRLLDPNGQVVGGFARLYPVTPYWDDDGQYITHEMFAASSDEAWIAVPNVAKDINAAWALFDDVPVRVMADKWNDTIVRIWSADSHLVPDVEEMHEQPARALATAWAAWKLAKSAKATG